MTEKSYYSLISRYYTKNARNTIVWEAKFTRTNYILFSSLKAHQEEKLLEAERVLAHKEPDVGIAKKNFDGYVLFNATALFIAIYYKPKGTVIYEIPIRSFLKEKYTSNLPSLTIEQAKKISTGVLA